LNPQHTFFLTRHKQCNSDAYGRVNLESYQIPILIHLLPPTTEDPIELPDYFWSLPSKTVFENRNKLLQLVVKLPPKEKSLHRRRKDVITTQWGNDHFHPPRLSLHYVLELAKPSLFNLMRQSAKTKIRARTLYRVLSCYDLSTHQKGCLAQHRIVLLLFWMICKCMLQLNNCLSC
jgi:hypothetical protein